MTTPSAVLFLLHWLTISLFILHNSTPLIQTCLGNTSPNLPFYDQSIQYDFQTLSGSIVESADIMFTTLYILLLLSWHYTASSSTMYTSPVWVKGDNDQVNKYAFNSTIGHFKAWYLG